MRFNSPELGNVEVVVGLIAETPDRLGSVGARTLAVRSSKDVGMESDRRQYHTLDGMRGLGAIAVMMRHADTICEPIVMPSSYLAVDVFFVLSGFVIAYAYDPRFERGMSTRSFIVGRFIRLYPLYFLGTLLAIFSMAVAHVIGAGVLNGQGVMLACLAGLLILPSPTISQADHAFIVNRPGWSLFFELVINLAFGLVWRWLTRPVLAGLVVLSGILLGVSVFKAGSCDVGPDWSNILFGFPRVAFSFFAGVLIERTLKKPHQTSWVGWLIPALMIPIFAVDVSKDLRPFYDLACVLVIFPALIVWGASYDPPPLGTKAFRFLGLISYPLYAVHFPVTELARRALRILHMDPTRYAPWLGLTLTAALALASWPLARLYDEPVRRAIAFRMRRKGHVPSPGVLTPD